VDVFCRFPCVVCFGVSVPFDQVLELPVASIMSVTVDLLHFIFCFSVDKVRQWPGKVGSVCSCFAIG
jgi:hypothetical protein